MSCPKCSLEPNLGAIILSPIWDGCFFPLGQDDGCAQLDKMGLGKKLAQVLLTP